MTVQRKEDDSHEMLKGQSVKMGRYGLICLLGLMLAGPSLSEWTLQCNSCDCKVCHNAGSKQLKILYEIFIESF